MQEDLISIIVPVYNVEIYLERCLKSIINQTYKFLEIILIDDGSTDTSGKICEEYKNMDSRITVIHQNNAGVSAARNVGLKIAHGKYVGFVDSDDYIEPNMYKVLYENLISYKLDISMCNFNVIKKNSLYSFYGECDKDSVILINGKIQFFSMLNENYYKGFLWNKLFLTKKAKKIGFKEDISMCEDLLFVVEYAKDDNTFGYCVKPLYNYLIRSNGTTKSPVSDKTISVLKAYEKIIKILRKCATSLVEEYQYSEMLWFIIIYNELPKERKNLKLAYITLYKKILKSKISIRKKIVIFLRKNFYFLYKIAKITYHFWVG